MVEKNDRKWREVGNEQTVNNFFSSVNRLKNIMEIRLAPPDASSDDRPNSGYNRDRPNRGDYGRCKLILFLLRGREKNMENFCLFYSKCWRWLTRQSER